MTKFNEIISELKKKNTCEAELIEERINIIIHKLKFITEDSIPIVNIQDFNNSFETIFTPLLEEKVKVAGGMLSQSLTENTQIIIFTNESIELFQLLPSFLKELRSNKVRAVLENKIFITKTNMHSDNEEKYTQDVELLAEIIHPKHFVFGQEGKEWTRFNLKNS